MQTFSGVESYLHRAAKSVLLGWLREASAEAGGNDWFNLDPIDARPNRRGPNFGIWEEYPILKDGHGADPLWDEHPLRLYPDGEDEPDLGEAGIVEGPPTPEKILARGLPIGCVVDIAITHKGRIKYAVEVVHRHPTPLWKRAFLERVDVELIEVSAKGIMHQIKRPDRLPLYSRRYA